MDPDIPSSTPREVKFKPKPPPRKKKKPIELKTEVPDDGAADDAAAEALLRRRLNERLGRQGPKVEKKSSVQVVFDHGASSSTSVRTFGKPREGNDDKSNGSQSGLNNSARENGQIVISSLSTAITDGTSRTAINAVCASSQKKKEYREPWDYHHTYYPITLPLRRPYSGPPELLDEAEFGEAAAADLKHDENFINPASELGLKEENEKAQMLFLQLPPVLPLAKRAASADGKVTADGSKLSGSEFASTSAKGKEVVGSSITSGKRNASVKACTLEELSGGYMGKMLVYKSGAVKLKLGETLYNVSPGSSCIFAQDVVAVNTNNKQCCVLGELGKRAVVTPDIDSLLDNVINLS